VIEQTYRRTVEVDRDKDYWHVELIDASYPFPSVEAATRFAQGHTDRKPVIVYPDGRVWDGKRFVA
jgi:hypothetical protein